MLTNKKGKRKPPNTKWARNINRLFTKEILLARKQMKKKFNLNNNKMTLLFIYQVGKN